MSSVFSETIRALRGDVSNAGKREDSVGEWTGAVSYGASMNLIKGFLRLGTIKGISGLEESIVPDRMSGKEQT